MRKMLLGCLGLACFGLVGSACGDDKCLSCVDCPDFRGTYEVRQVPMSEMCDAYYLIDGFFFYDVTVQDGNDLEIMLYGTQDLDYHGEICGSKDSSSPRAFPFAATYVDLVETGETIRINLAGEFVEPYGSEPAKMVTTINIILSHPTDPRFDCMMMGDSSGYRIE